MEHKLSTPRGVAMLVGLVVVLNACGARPAAGSGDPAEFADAPGPALPVGLALNRSRVGPVPRGMRLLRLATELKFDAQWKPTDRSGYPRLTRVDLLGPNADGVIEVPPGPQPGERRNPDGTRVFTVITFIAYGPGMEADGWSSHHVGFSGEPSALSRPSVYMRAAPAGCDIRSAWSAFGGVALVMYEHFAHTGDRELAVAVIADMYRLTLAHIASLPSVAPSPAGDSSSATNAEEPMCPRCGSPARCSALDLNVIYFAYFLSSPRILRGGGGARAPSIDALASSIMNGSAFEKWRAAVQFWDVCGRDNHACASRVLEVSRRLLASDSAAVRQVGLVMQIGMDVAEEQNASLLDLLRGLSDSDRGVRATALAFLQQRNDTGASFASDEARSERATLLERARASGDADVRAFATELLREPTE